MSNPILDMILKGWRTSDSKMVPVNITDDGAAKVELSTAEPPIHVGATPPADTSGQLLWSNTNAGQEGVYFYDPTRSKWVDQSFMPGFNYGRDSANNQIIRSTGISTSGTGAGVGLPNQNMTLVGIRAHGRAGNATKGFQVRVNGTPIQSFALSGYEFDDQTLDVDIAAGAGQYVDVFAESAGSAVQDVSVTLLLRRRGP